MTACNHYPNDDALAAMAADSKAALVMLLTRGDRRIATLAREASGPFWFSSDRDDLRQQGRIGVCRAVRSYVPRSGPFWTYARHWIGHEVTRWLAYCGQPIHYPAAEFTLSRRGEVMAQDVELVGADGSSELIDLIDVPAATRIAFLAMNAGHARSVPALTPRVFKAIRKLDANNQLDMWRNHGSDDCQK